MNREQQEEYDNLKAKAEALFQAHCSGTDSLPTGRVIANNDQQ